MPGKIKVKILAGRNLPVMDRSGDTTDAYVELKFGNITYKTDVCRKSLNPQWNSEWYRFEVDDAELQDEPLQIRLMDHDTYSANDAIGKVYVNLNPLLLPGMLPPVKNIWTLEAAMNTTAGSQGSVMTGWIPVYDTMHGIRGEVNIIIKVELFSDFNKFRQSSCGVQFFYSPNIPYGYHAQMIHGFVEELVVSDDPEYKWIDKIRTPRASNEARQTLFFKLSGEVQRKIGLKALDLGGNAVIGYLQNFDLEGESGIVARGIGTAVTLVKLHDVLGFPCDSVNIEEITFALSSRTKTQAECFDTDDGEPLIPISLPACIPALHHHPPSVSTQPVDRGLSSYSAPSASLTCLERSTRAFGTRGCARTRRKYARFPFLRSPTSNTLSLRALGRSGGRDFLSPDDTRKKSSRYRLSKQIKHLRDKFDSLGEESRLAAESDRDSDSLSWRAVHLKKQRSPTETETSGKLMAALLIGSIHNMPLKIADSADPLSASPGDEYIEMTELKTRRTYGEENSQENTDVTDSDKDKDEQRRDASSSPEETERSSSCENDNSTGDDLSDDTTSYKILDDSRYSLNKDSDRAEDSPSLQEKIPVTPSSLESCRLSSLNLTSTEEYVELRRDAIPIITVDAHESGNSDARRGKEAPLRVPRVRSHPDSIFSGQIYSAFSTFHVTSRSCGSSLVNLTDRRTRVSAGSGRAVVSPALAIDRPSDGGSPRSSRSSPKSNCCKSDAVSAVCISKPSVDTNRPTCPCPHVTSGVVAVRKCSSVCNLEEASCHIDCTKLSTNTANITYNSCVSRPSPDLRQQDEGSVSPSCPLPAVSSMAVKMSQSPATRTLANVPLHRRSSDSDLSVTPKGNSLGSSERSMAGLLRTPAAVVRPMNQDTLEMLEYPFITMQHYPLGFILHIGGLVSSRSVKLLERISNLEEPEGRDAWWTEIRMEVRSHARALACNVVIGYKEETSICDDVCVLSASGTAAVINLHNSGQDSDGVVLNKLQHLQLQQGASAATAAESDREKGQQKLAATKPEKVIDGDVPIATHPERQNGRTCRHSSESNDHEAGQSQLRCNLCHLPYSDSSVPFRVNVSKCAICKRAKVPDVMFTTIEVPANIPTTGRGCFIQATVCKNKKDLRGELNAKEISDCLPFLDYELHSLLLNKLKIKGMNAVFGLRLQVSIGERFIIGMAVGTAVYLTALPPPTIPQIASGNSWHNEEQLAEMQKSIVETVKKNREFYHLKPIGVNEMENGRVVNNSDTDESDEDLPELDLGLGTRDACVLEVDDIEDMDRISSLMDDRPPDDFHVVNTQTIPGLEDLEIVRNLQMFTQVWRAKIPTGHSVSMPSKCLARLLQSLYFKLRRMVPCALCDMQFKVALAEQDEIQLTVVGMALGLGEPLNADKYKRKIVHRSLSKDQVRKPDDSDMIFSLDEDHLENNTVSDNTTRTCIGNPATLNSVPIQKPRPRSPLRSKILATHRRKHVPLKGRYGVDITPLSYLPGGRIERYQGNLNFFFIRESTSIRENGGLSGFTHSFVMEVLAIVRAHITALGGNAMVAFFMTQCVLLHSPHKNQGQCLINVGGDVVTVSYYADEKHSTISNC
ncbi:hypothetical protein X777_03634 [Ooceraea biroi]|uniref:C2 domain-containing protein n=1 Tax=Ooceraea biroi TaxID=2015173 RepID=A0A026WLH3_OOCBI|nr:hypothetical protein X777_03634 [Ooceraea biroi]